MKRWLIHLVLWLGLPAVALRGQIVFERWYGGADMDEGYSVIQVPDRGYLIAGYTVSFGAGQSDCYVIRTDEYGDTLWTKTYGGPGNDIGYSVIQTSDGGYAISGATYSFGPGAVYLIKINAVGDTLWTATYGAGYRGYSVIQTPDSGYIIAGCGDDACFVRTDTQGDTLWTKKYGGSNWDYLTSICPTSDGGYFAVGGTYSYGNHYCDVYLMKINADGDTLWTKRYGGADHDWAHDGVQTADGGYAVIGGTNSYGAGDCDVYLLKLNSTGDTLWTRTYGRIYADAAYSIAQTPDGGYIIAGETDPSGMDIYDVYLIKTNSAGDTLWTRRCGGPAWEYANSLTMTYDRGYAITGITESYGAGWNDVYLIKEDSLGTIGVGEQNPGSGRAPVGVRLRAQPNPFRHATRISAGIGSATQYGGEGLGLRIYDLSGRLVKTMVLNSTLFSNSQSLTWDGTDQDGRSLPDGVYFVRVEMGGRAVLEKIVKTK